MATRTHARQMVVELLYAYAMGNERIFDFADELLDAKKIRNAQADFAKSLFGGVVAHLAQIDSIINANLKSWELSRLGAIDKCILRLGVYEILKGEIDAPVAINEAIEIAKILGAENTGRFVNGVLDAVRKGEFDLEKGVENAENMIDSREVSADSVDSSADSANRAKNKNIKKGTNQKRFTKKGANRKVANRKTKPKNATNSSLRGKSQSKPKLKANRKPTSSLQGATKPQQSNPNHATLKNRKNK